LAVISALLGRVSIALVPKVFPNPLKIGSRKERQGVLLELFKILQIAEETTHLQDFSF
jgi:hypothetical protein